MVEINSVKIILNKLYFNFQRLELHRWLFGVQILEDVE